MYIDSNIFIYAYGNTGVRSHRCRAFLSKIERGKQRSITSIFALNEVLKVMSEVVGEETAIISIEKIMKISNLNIVGADIVEFNLSLVYFRQKLGPTDAMHCAIMKKNKITAILTYDRDFDNIKNIKRVEP